MKRPPPSPLLGLAAAAVVGAHPGLVVRVRPATAFERATWKNCPLDGLRVLLDEDGTMTQNYGLSADLPWAEFVSIGHWQLLVKLALEQQGAAS